MTNATTADTPMMRQFREVKAGYPDAILFFRLGDFYEMFLDDAVIASRVLELTLTGRGKDDNRVPMCGIPHHASENYIYKLVQQGYKVAVCEQVEDPSEAKGITRREVVRVVTPGTIQSEGVLNEKDNNFLVAVCYDKKQGQYGVSFVDISTGEFRGVVLYAESEVLAFIDRLQPKECVMDAALSLALQDEILVNKRIFLSRGESEKKLTEFFHKAHLSSFGHQDMEACYPAAWAILAYLKETQKHALPQITRLLPIYSSHTMYLDRVTVRNLELTQSLYNQDKKGTLFHILDFTKTAMGGRKLKSALTMPLASLDKITKRLDAVQSLKEDLLSREEIREVLGQVYDLERLVSRIVSDLNNPKDMLALQQSLKNISELTPILSHLSGQLLESYFNYFVEFCDQKSAFFELYQLIESSIVEEPPRTIKEGNLIKPGVSTELDELRASFKSIKDWMGGLEAQERQSTGIKTLKVGFNKVFGYYIEVSRTGVDSVPEHYIRKQTLTNGERFITPELKEKEAILLNGEEKQAELEYAIYKEIVAKIKGYVPHIQKLAAIVADIDFLQSMATASQKYNYTRPEFVEDQDRCLEIINGRHPVLEKKENVTFVSNSVTLTKESNRVHLITGPNMAGKSTLMRQVALTVIMAQVGCFVPAESLKLSIVDKLFTRIGALDNLYAGQSTFMVEMVETASILNTATSQSVILLDEIGRGTATYDGMSIAWAVTEHIHNVIGARTFFATHYHELTVLEETLPHLGNFNMQITESNDSIVFNYKLVKGPANKSYGLHVAELAGLPGPVLKKAGALLAKFETGERPSSQMSLWT